MAHSNQARKRVRQNEQRRLINKSSRSTLRTQIKKFEVAAEKGDFAVAETELKAATSQIDKAIKHGLVHRNMGARKKSQLAKKMNSVRS